MFLTLFQKPTRDRENNNWFWIQKIILSKYAKKMGSSGFLIYSALAYFANSKTQSCFPTQETLAKLTGLSRRTVARKLKLLEELGLIRRERRKNKCIYWLLEPDVTEMSYPCDRAVTSDVTKSNTDKNYLTKINNNDMDGFFNFPGISASKGRKPKTREEVLALDIAKALEDEKHLPLYLYYAKKFPESFLRGILGEVMEIPQGKLRKGRAAYFNYLVQKYGKKKDPCH